MKLRPLVAFLALSASSCGWDAMPDDDAGQAAWVMQVVPAIIGRNVRDSDELAVLVSIANNEGREVVVDLLFQDPDFERYWTLVLLDGLDIPIDETPVGQGIDPDCLYPSSPVARHEDPLSATELASIAARLDDPGAVYDPGSTYSGAPLRYTDIVRTAVAQDRLDLAYVGLLPVMSSAAPLDDRSGRELANRDVVMDRFLDTYLGRTAACMACHTSNYSVTGGTHPERTFNRHWPMLAPTPDGGADIERSLFGRKPDCNTSPNLHCDPNRREGGQGFGADEKRAVQDLFTSGLYPYKGAPLHYPWNLAGDCVVRYLDPAPTDGTSGIHGLRLWQDADTWGGQDVDPHFGDLFEAGNGGVSTPDGSALDLVPYLVLGVQGLANPSAIENPIEPMPLPAADQQAIEDQIADLFWTLGQYGYAPYDDPGSTEYDQAWVDTRANLETLWVDQHKPTQSCVNNCHTTDAFLRRVPDERIVEVLRTVYPMTGICGDEACEVAAIRNMREQTAVDPDNGNTVSLAFDPPDQLGTPSQAFAFAVAQQAVNLVFEEVGGERLTLSHGFPRNADQADVLGTLTETLVTNDWSLRAVLSQMVLSKAFNRQDLDADGADPHVVPAITDPYAWSEWHFSGPGERLSTQGSLVHRASPELLTQKLSRALGWPSAWNPGLPGGSSIDYPLYEDLWDLGRAQTPNGGESETTLTNLAAWEANFASCEKPDRVWNAEIGGSLSWATSTSNDWTDWIDALIATGMSRESALILLKERLVGHPSIDDERRFIEEIWPNLGIGLQPADEPALRQFCSTLLKSPGFMLVGLPSSPEPDLYLQVSLPQRPFFRDEPNGLLEHCEHWGREWSGGECVLPADPPPPREGVLY